MTRDEAERLLDELIDTCECSHPDCEAKHAKARAAVLAAMTRATPPGWTLVPETPTPDQLRAAASAFNEAPLHSLDGQTFTLSEWRAIISPFAAAPEAAAAAIRADGGPK